MLAGAQITDAARDIVLDRGWAAVRMGQIATEDFGTNLSYGVSLIWHGSEDSFYQFDLGRASLQRTSAERLGTEADLNIEDGHDMNYMHLSAGWNVVPGEFRWRGRSLPVTGYLLAGGGQTQLLGQNEFAFNLGTGLRDPQRYHAAAPGCTPVHLRK